MEQEDKKKTMWWKKVIYALAIIAFLAFLGSSDAINTTSLSEEQKDEIRQNAYNDVLKELETNSHPTGILGVKYYMTQTEVKTLFNDVVQFDTDILSRPTAIYGRPVQANYHFTDGRLMQISISFQEQFSSLDEMSASFYQTQEKLDADYGQMSVTLNEIQPPVGDQWTNQQILAARKSLGRTAILHQVSVKDNGLGEQILMYLSSAKE